MLAMLAVPVLTLEVGAAEPRKPGEYPPTADSLPQPGVPKGKLEKFTWDKSKIFPGTVREVTVYVPSQYDAARPAALDRARCSANGHDRILQFPASSVDDSTNSTGTEYERSMLPRQTAVSGS